MSKDSGEILREPMLQCLKRITEELAERLQEVNRFVEEKTSKKLNLEVISIVQKTETDYRIRVRGISHTGRMVEEEFQILWWSHTCPAHFHLHQWGRVAFGPGYNFIYCGVIDAWSKILAREIGIYTHHLQIPGVLSR
ncbi:MAG: hypothetical protein US25_C0028G0003 [Candidatus Moranbacteria bacterium GW2011_GWE1_36_7]|nr:MAG: hypothetical protein UR99_C0042G0007 [Candidatus Moranbacteria bacterium GW2011_GWD2_36_12]KKQ05026.1 MAG: hypothetical protein US16_C0040G0007 [Candidatus Moranbacteria bacterium GW2011_GWE2_36_40]KKQ14253.1 MAG: hypothetical protein US25_C0028G0003 [Candidatus Moranbacteria bacterium GW2011_GWE1_36_7]